MTKKSETTKTAFTNFPKESLEIMLSETYVGLCRQIKGIIHSANQSVGLISHTYKREIHPLSEHLGVKVRGLSDKEIEGVRDTARQYGMDEGVVEAFVRDLSRIALHNKHRERVHKKRS